MFLDFRIQDSQDKKYQKQGKKMRNKNVIGEAIN